MHNKANDTYSLAHTSWKCQYHIVFAPKYRRKAIYGKLKAEQYWNPSNIRLVKEAEASILRRWEYEEELKKVISEKCVNCVHYEEDAEGDNLKGHREKISLDGECWGYEKKK